MKQKIITQCIRIAKRSLASHPELNNFPHLSFIVQDKKLIEWATNSCHEPPIHFGYSREEEPDFRPKLHSELWAFKRARGLLNNGPFEILNIRLNRLGKIKLSRPCKKCFKLLASLGCKTFYYSSDCGFLKLRTQ